MDDPREARLALIPTLAEQSPAGYIGRTALMKYMYFLQTLKGVPLGYRFTLYSYGPFDSDVLADLASAETLNAVETEPILYSGGYGFRIRPGLRAAWLKRRSQSFLARHKSDISWLFRNFGQLTSAELELASTIVYVQKEAAQHKKKLTLADLVEAVHDVKPHFTKLHVYSFAKKLASDKLVSAASS